MKRVLGRLPIEYLQLDRAVAVVVVDLGEYIVFSGPFRIPAPNPTNVPNRCSLKPLTPETPEKGAITGMSTAAFDPTGGVPRPAPFPIAKTVLPNPIADPGTGHRNTDVLGNAPGT